MFPDNDKRFGRFFYPTYNDVHFSCESCRITVNWLPKFNQNRKVLNIKISPSFRLVWPAVVYSKVFVRDGGT